MSFHEFWFLIWEPLEDFINRLSEVFKIQICHLWESCRVNFLVIPCGSKGIHEVEYFDFSRSNWFIGPPLILVESLSSKGPTFSNFFKFQNTEFFNNLIRFSLDLVTVSMPGVLRFIFIFFIFFMWWLVYCLNTGKTYWARHVKINFFYVFVVFQVKRAHDKVVKTLTLIVLVKESDTAWAAFPFVVTIVVSAFACTDNKPEFWSIVFLFFRDSFMN